MFADATVSLQSIEPVLEGQIAEICVNLSDIPNEGLECDVVVELTLMDGTAS